MNKEPLDAALADLVRAYYAARHVITAMATTQQALEGASRLTDHLQDLTNASAAERAELARKIHDDEGATLLSTGAIIGATRQRAGQIVAKGRKARP